MQIVPKGNTAPNIQSSDPRSDYTKAQEKRANAIKAFRGEQPPVRDPNQVSPEEALALKPQQSQQVTEEIRQDSTVVDDTTQVPEANVAVKQPEDPTLSRQFAQLARETKAIRAKQLQLEQASKAKEAAFAEREAAIKARESQYTDDRYIPRDKLKQNALQTILDEGVTYDELTQQLMNTNQPLDPRITSTVSKLEAKIAALETQLKTSEEKITSSETHVRETAMKQLRNDVNQLVNSDPNFETIKATKSHKDVVELIEKTYDEDGILLSVEEAAQEVENHILEEAEKLYKIGKIAKRLGMQNTPKPQATQTQAVPKQTQPGIKTLTNALSSSRQISARERAIRRAEGFKGDF